MDSLKHSCLNEFMKKLSVFNFVSLDGYYKNTHNDISWHQHGGEEAEFSAQSMKSESALLFGRVTFEMMQSFWTTPEAAKTLPEVAKGMNRAKKYVVSRTMKNVTWENSNLLSGDLVDEVKKLKQNSDRDITILGSGSLVTQLTDAGLIDAYQIMIDPVVLGDGASIFKGLEKQKVLKLKDTRMFKSGTVLLSYESNK